MALPYPSMSFVPLDVLSADELNQMVANDQYLAGLFPIQTASIANGAVTKAKLDSGILAVYDTGDLTTSAGISAWGEFPDPLSLPAGTYLLLGTFQGVTSASEFKVGIHCGTDIDYRGTAIKSDSTITSVSLMGVKTITSSTSFYGFVGQWTASGAKYHLTAIRLG